MPKPYPRNVPGPFYVEDQCCLTCGVAHEVAPDFLAWDRIDGFSHCYVQRQPQTSAEIDLAILVMKVSDLDCIRYAGSDPSILQELAARNLGEQCDALVAEQIERMPKGQGQ